MASRTVPWISTIRAGLLPARAWRPSTFWVTRVWRRPPASRGTRAWWPSLGSTPSHIPPWARTSHRARRTSGSVTKTRMSEAFSASGLRVHTPFGPRKSGMPLSVEMPAPVSTVTEVALATSEAARSTASTRSASIRRASQDGPTSATVVGETEGIERCQKSLSESGRGRSVGGSEGAGQVDQEPDPEARPSRDHLAVVTVGERRAGDVQMGPRDPVSHELAQDQPGSERPAV